MSSPATDASASASTPTVWSNGAYANGTGPSTLPVIQPPPPRSESSFPVLKNDLILRAARGEVTERTPVWCHRQAGRYLPEFKETRKAEGGDFFKTCQTPRAAVELTLQPIRRFALDAAIIFSDILVIPQALGMEVLMKEGVGPVLPSPIKTPDLMTKLKKREEVDVPTTLKYVFDALHLCRHSLQGQVPLIGFSGAPWTLFCYMVEGGGAKSYTHARSWLFAYPDQSKQLLALITDTVIEYLILQVAAGAQLLEVFDTWSGELTAECFREFVLPCVKKIAHEVKKGLKEKGLPAVSMTLFPKGSDYCIPWIADETEFDCISLDWSTSAEDAVKALQGKRRITLQGNLDPAVFYAPEAQVRLATRQMLDAFGDHPHIANLGHGMLPDHPLESLRTFVDEVHKYSEEKKKQQQK